MTSRSFSAAMVKNGIEEKYINDEKQIQRRNFEKKIQNNKFWLNALTSRYKLNELKGKKKIKEVDIMGIDKKMKQINSKNIQKTAKKLINLEEYLHCVLMPEEIKN